MNKFNISFIQISLFISVFFTAACDKSNAIQCIKVNGEKICFVREVWGFNGESFAITTTNNACHKPDKQYDYVSNSERGFDYVTYKVEDNKLYIYAATLIEPQNKFPVEVIFVPYDPLKTEEEIKREGYQELPLTRNEMTWCLL